jgi:uncharacterized membrane protein YebE (DUF533 family)
MSNERAHIITDLLLGAAHADGRMDGREAEKVKELVRTLTTDPDVLASCEKRITNFVPAKFDVQEAAKGFLGESEDQRYQLLELVAQIHAADEELDLEEDDYLRSLGNALGLPDNAFEDLVLDYSVEEKMEMFEDLTDVKVD